ncbi:hypothetical protein [Dactylosporangium sp. CA-139066]|uniref:hypothetical protein n=1 Tax=Dactylosporangium sp. CA-139066 TaxID=3239930 RepID=UPI003D8E6BF7
MAHEDYAGLFGHGHPHTLAALNNFAVAERAMGDIATAVFAVELAHDELARALHPEHPHRLAARLNLVVLEFGFGTVGNEPAQREAEAVAELLGAGLGDRHPATLLARADAALMRTGGEPGHAAVRALAEVLGANHPEVRALEEGRLVAVLLDPHPF